jgi:hypothetical protein
MKLEQDIISQNTIDSDAHGSSSGPGNYTKVIDKVLTCVNDHLLILINQMLNSADHKLFDQAEKAKSDEEQMKYMDCTRIFRTERNDIGHHFFINLNTSLSAIQKNTSNSNNEELSLVDQDEMEEMVAITTMHSKAMSLYGEEVNHLEARLEYLEIMGADIFDNDSLDPKHICEVFQKTIENIDIAIEVKLIFYKLFDQEVCSKLGVMYKTINQIFIDNGIMPEIVLKTTSREEAEYNNEEVSSRVATYYDPNEKVETDFIPRTKQDISRIVNEFMNGDMTITGDEIELPESFLRTPTKHDLDGKNCYERKEVVKALSKLQHKLSSLQDKSESLTTEQIKQELLADISNENGGVLDKQVSLLDERSIDFVGMMFDAITNDDTVSEIMTGMIKSLQIPVIKVAMTDNSLFEQEEHPARVTVDLLTTAGKGINSEEDRLYHELEEIVNSILDDFDVDLGTFETAVDMLEDIILKEEKLTNETERQQQKQILQEHARHIVITQLKMVSCNRQIPNNVRPLVLKHWSTLMLNRYIRHGRDSSQWMQSVLLLKLLLKCMQPIRFQSQYNLVKNNHMALIEAVNDELYETQQDKNDVADQIATLKTFLMKMIDDYGYKITDKDDNELTEEELIEDSTDNTEKELQHIQQQTEIARQKIAQLAGNTKPGVWYEIFNGEDKPIRRLKLSVILTDAAKLIFVDRKGVKIIEKDAEDFARDLHENRSRILADHSTFDNALGKVITALAA